MATILEGYLREMLHQPEAPVQYRMVTDEASIPLNEIIGRQITLTATGDKACVVCGRKVKKLYQSGYCFPCVTTLAQCDLCIVKPHECHYHLGTCRDDAFGESHCMIPHYVYLAFSSGVKVGLTRKGRQYTRWVDQGAAAAVLVAELSTRKEAGEVEMAIASFLPDKTQWRKMLALQQLEASDLDVLQSARDQVVGYLHANLPQVHVLDDSGVHTFQYPRVPDAPIKLSSLSMDKAPVISSTLQGVKGQYLILDDGVLNVKKHAGVRVTLAIS